ncbi:MAG: FadR family transcriptional regulator [Desulfobulbaceae bacterium]|nr:FadR family transcriptional regulator [Desulfofustis sp.]NNK57343.1 FadR family transcriptional regulator [Desulfofustis sp.]RZW26104.1 MAG: FadR family transcriptional regulator [Desulfobulbaceae bacterium]
MTNNKKLSKAKPVDKVEQALAALHEYIVDGELEPGTELPSESEMVEQIGVSKFVMREALRVAQSQGLVEISQGRRTRVADISIKPAAGLMNLALKRSNDLLLELTEARRTLEISMVQLAAKRRTDAQVKAMEETVAMMENHQGDLLLCVEKDIEFHEIMAQATGNRVFEMIHESIAELLSDSRRETMLRSGVDLPVAEHRRVLDAIREQDPEEAVAAMSAHLDTAELSLKQN